MKRRITRMKHFLALRWIDAPMWWSDLAFLVSLLVIAGLLIAFWKA